MKWKWYHFWGFLGNFFSFFTLFGMTSCSFGGRNLGIFLAIGLEEGSSFLGIPWSCIQKGFCGVYLHKLLGIKSTGIHFSFSKYSCFSMKQKKTKKDRKKERRKPKKNQKHDIPWLNRSGRFRLNRKDRGEQLTTILSHSGIFPVFLCFNEWIWSFQVVPLLFANGLTWCRWKWTIPWRLSPAIKVMCRFQRCDSC